MNYNITVFGVKDTSEEIITYIETTLCKVDLIVTVTDAVKGRNEISGGRDLDAVAKRFGIEVFAAQSYSLDDDITQAFFKNNTFGLGISMGWQRLIPKSVLDAFDEGVFGFHGNAGYLPFGRGRSPLNWSILLGDERFNLNLFRYDEKADSPNVFATGMFRINVHDDIRTAQYKNMIVAKQLIARLITAHKEGKGIAVRTDSKDFDSWYEKRTAADGKIDWHARTRDIYNLIRAVASPFPGAWCHVEADGAPAAGDALAPLLKVWKAQPFDDVMDLHDFAPGEIVDIFDDCPIVRTVDGSLLITRYECDMTLAPGMILT